VYTPVAGVGVQLAAPLESEMAELEMVVPVPTLVKVKVAVPDGTAPPDTAVKAAERVAVLPLSTVYAVAARVAVGVAVLTVIETVAVEPE
jgi:hypothetical protein